MKDTINTCILNSMKLNELLLNDSNIHSTLINIVDLIVNSYKKVIKYYYAEMEEVQLMRNTLLQS